MKDDENTAAIYSLQRSKGKLMTHFANIASARVALKSGFRAEGALRQWVYNPRTESWQDETMFSILCDEYAP